MDEEPEHDSAEVLASVGFLSGALPVLRILDTCAEGEASLDENELIGAYLIARFSAFDSDLNSGTRESNDLSNAIGSRLYSSTRSAVDRAIARVERESQAGLLSEVGLADVVA